MSFGRSKGREEESPARRRIRIKKLSELTQTRFSELRSALGITMTALGGYLNGEATIGPRTEAALLQYLEGKREGQQAARQSSENAYSSAVATREFSKVVDGLRIPLAQFARAAHLDASTVRRMKNREPVSIESAERVLGVLKRSTGQSYQFFDIFAALAGKTKRPSPARIRKT